MSALDGLATALQSAVGADALLTETASAAYAIDGRAPTLVVLPADEEQITTVLRLADAHHATVFLRGGGNHMMLGNPPERVDLVLSLQRLQQQIAYEPGDMTTTVQAGHRLADLQRTLGAQGQFLALDPPAAATTTVGGMVAANRSGPRRLLYGSARDLLLGTTVITIDGTRTKAGGRVVKNVTGYDLNKLYIGSLGTLAVLVELTFKVHPLPPGEQTLGIGFSTHADMESLTQAVMQLPLRLNSLTVVNAAAVSAIAPDDDLSMPDTPYLLLTRVEGTPQIAARQIQRITDALQHLSPIGETTTQTWEDDAQTYLWRRVEEFSVALPATRPHSVMSKISVPISNVPALCEAVQTAATQTGATWPVLAHAGHGIAYVHIPIADAAATSDALQHVHALDACVASVQGRRVIEHAPVALKRRCDVWGSPGDDFALMRAIKQSFDPHNRLNPGRFLGGL